MIAIRRIAPQDAELLRTVRLHALADSPLAFGSTYAREVAFPEQEWQSRATRQSTSSDAACFLAFDGDSCCGIIASFREAEVPGQACIVSMWVAPEARRRGVASRLIEAVEIWARSQNISELLLDVTDINTAAIELYKECGFEFTGESAPYPNDSRYRELFMHKALTEKSG